MSQFLQYFLFTNKTGRKLYAKVVIFGKEYTVKLGTLVRYHWKQDFSAYFLRNDMKKKIKLLKKNLDKISCDYIDHFMKLVPYWGCFKNNLWTKYDLLTNKKMQEFETTFEQPYPDVLTIQPYLFSNIYGLSDLPEFNFNNIDGKIIIDGGGWNGDTGVVFHRYFQNSEIHVYEPLSVNIEKINKILSIDDCNNKIKPIRKALGNYNGEIEIKYGVKEIAEISTIDSLYNDAGTKIGLIKLDTEGFETQIIDGALDVIKRDKPVLAVAIYHTPKDFFELKSKIEELDLGYKFMIRRSEMILPQADLVLIAY